MADLRESFTTKKKDKFPSLLFLAARLVFYINNNTVYNLEKTVNHVWNCKYYLYSRCKKANGPDDYCDLCTISNRYHSYFTFTIKRIDYLIKEHISLIEDFQEHKDIEIFTGDYKEYSRDLYDGSKSEWSLYSYVYKTNYIKCNTFN